MKNVFLPLHVKSIMEFHQILYLARLKFLLIPKTDLCKVCLGKMQLVRLVNNFFVMLTVNIY